ncbi:MAG: hypothetical protein V5A59_13890, partial [Bacteroidales bacterium]
KLISLYQEFLTPYQEYPSHCLEFPSSFWGVLFHYSKFISRSSGLLSPCSGFIYHCPYSSSNSLD